MSYDFADSTVDAAVIAELRAQVAKLEAALRAKAPAPQAQDTPAVPVEGMVIPCDVMLPPATIIRKGCALGTLMTAFSVRERDPLYCPHFAPTTSERPCTCHPDEAPIPCQKKYAFSECRNAALSAPQAQDTPDYVEHTQAGTINWKMEVERLNGENNRLRGRLAVQEAQVKAEDEIYRLRTALEDAVDTLEAMDLHVDNLLYDRLRVALEDCSHCDLG